MKKLQHLFLTIALFSLTILLEAQDSTCWIIGFYNVENLFHPSNDSLKNDDAFTPDGFNHWTYRKYVRKVNNIAKVILAIGKKEPPDLMGLAEIENDAVLRKLCYDSPLKKYQYRFVHYESPDARGIDVALIYRSNRLRITHSRAIPIIFPFDTLARNRDILYAVVQFPNGDSLHLFVNHWTSRYGGYAPTIAKRNYYARVVRTHVDSILQENQHAAILITGDFNDYPTDESMTEVLRAGDIDKYEHHDYQLFNLMHQLTKLPNIGSHKREDFWGCLDQIIVSPALLHAHNSIFVLNQEAEVFKADFMIEPDEKYGGYKTYRTFLGPRYLGGYADHLPVFVRIGGWMKSVSAFQKPMMLIEK